ncbi:hypothetical protein CTAYLR_004677, partial [Chrysophaeum taylorii]
MVDENSQGELKEYIAMIRANPRVRTPGGTRQNLHYEANLSLPRVVEAKSVDFGKISALTWTDRFRKDRERSVNENMATFRARSRQGSRRGSRERRGNTNVSFLPQLSRRRTTSASRDKPRALEIGPGSDVLNVEKALAVIHAVEERETVREALASRRVSAAPRMIEDEPLVAAIRSDEPGEFEATVRQAYVKARIEKIKRHPTESSPAPPQGKLMDVESPSSRAPSGLEDLERSAREKVLRRLDGLEVAHNLRCKMREGVSLFKSVASLTDQPKKWVESQLVDAVLSGAPAKAWRQLRALGLFPQNAPASLDGAARAVYDRLRGRKLESSWIAKRLGELRAGVATEPLVVTSARLLLFARQNERQNEKKTFSLEKEEDDILAEEEEGGYGNGWCALHYASFERDAAVIRLVASRLGADIEARVPLDGSTPLHLAIARSTAPRAVVACCVLLELGANASVADFADRTPLHKAAARGLQQIADLLLVAGAMPWTKDKDNRTPVDAALAAGHSFCAEKIRIYRSPLEDDLETLSPEKRMDAMAASGGFNKTAETTSEQKRPSSLAGRTIRRTSVVVADDRR